MRRWAERSVSRFLLASLNIKAILQETTLHRRREKLDIITNSLGLRGAYDATIGRIKAQEGDGARLGVEALMWISHSERPLSVGEICHALAVEIGTAEINTNNVPSIRTVLGCCQGLVAVDSGSSTIRLIHFTLKEYLSRHADLFDRPHSRIAETCLTYLNFKAIRDLAASPSRDLRGSSFLGYSSLYWGTHMRMDLSENSRYLALALLNQYDNHISAELLWESVQKQFFTSRIKPFPALHCVSYFGIAEVAIDLIKTKWWDVNQRDSMGLTPLIWAAKYGHEEVVKSLLEQKGIQPDRSDDLHERTALSWAAGSGHEGVVRLFLEASVLFGNEYINPDKPDNFGKTPLSWAAMEGKDGTVRLLLEQEEVNPDRPSKYGQTPLSWAAWHGNDEVVKLLLVREDVNPEGSGDRGAIPLSSAARNGHYGVVKLLLEREDVDPNRPDVYGRTPLSWAAGNGHVGVVKLLLEQEDVSPDRPDNYGLTPLSLAARNGDDSVVKLLLEREDISPDRPDNNGRTPLSWVAGNGHGGLAKLLLEREDISPDRPDNRGRTPLSWAAGNKHGGLVNLLLEREDVSPDRLDNNGQTPLSWAARYGHFGVVELLKARKPATSSAV